VEEAEAPRTSRVAVIRAAGGVVVRRRNGEVQVLVVHRPAYDDWSFPKGKALPGETDEECALREVAEETGLVCALGAELPSTEYRDAKGRLKRVRYWSMRVEDGALSFEHEVDAACWLAIEEAGEVLTYARDVAVLGSVQQFPVSG
jgi:8-oxo-dGTP pyrophosphatase MutT (NUDIX family)